MENLRKYSEHDKQRVRDLIKEWEKIAIIGKYESLTDEIYLKEKSTSVIEINGVVAGYSVITTFNHMGTSYYEIDSFFISRKHKGKKLGEKLIKYTEDRIKGYGGKKVLLKPMAVKGLDIDELIKYYEAQGYSASSVRPELNLLEKEI